MPTVSEGRSQLDETSPLLCDSSVTSFPEGTHQPRRTRRQERGIEVRRIAHDDLEQGRGSKMLRVRLPSHSRMTEESVELLRNGIALCSFGIFLLFLVALHVSVHEKEGTDISKVAGPAGALFVLWGVAFIGGTVYELLNHAGTELEIGEETFSYRSVTRFGKDSIVRGAISAADVAVIARTTASPLVESSRSPEMHLKWMWGTAGHHLVLWRSENLEDLVYVATAIHSFLLEIVPLASEASQELEFSSVSSGSDSER